MIEKILNKFGYVKGEYRNLSEKPFTEVELSQMISDLIYVEDINIDKDFDNKVYEGLKQVEGYVEYLRIMAERDKSRYFSAQTPLEQLITKGAYSRAHYLKAKVMGEKGAEESKLENIRYD